MPSYYVYILTSKINGTLYIGLTNDLERRILEHKSKTYKGFTAKYDINLLAYFEEFDSHKEAYSRELQLKKWKIAWKLELIEKENPVWKDLSKDWFD